MEERYSVLRESINVLYLKVGGYNEIMSMSYWDFVSIMETLSDTTKRDSGQPVIKEGLTSTQRQMIERRKAQR